MSSASLCFAQLKHHLHGKCVPRKHQQRLTSTCRFADAETNDLECSQIRLIFLLQSVSRNMSVPRLVFVCVYVIIVGVEWGFRLKR